MSYLCFIIARFIIFLGATKPKIIIQIQVDTNNYF
jgi:hypothetical protein